MVGKESECFYHFKKHISGIMYENPEGPRPLSLPPLLTPMYTKYKF